MKKIVIASDSFKGCLSSAEVAESAREGVLRVFPDCKILSVSVADGGEGTIDALVDSLGGNFVTAPVKGPLGDPVGARYGMAGDLAVIEMAQASGLTLIEPERRNPMLTSTYGTGELILDAARRGCRRFLVGLGGSATNDGGTGMLTALGVRFLDSDGNVLAGRGADLERIADIDMSGLDKDVRSSSFSIACDVDTPFCGPQGTAQIFAPQKGADARMVEDLDRGMESFARIISGRLGIDISNDKGAGAAGGLGGAFKAFLGAKLERGVEIVLDTVGFDETIRGADLVITGEGSIDSQTSKGKTAYGVLCRAKRQGIPVVAIGGKVENGLEDMGFALVRPILEREVPLEVAMEPSFAAANIKDTVEQILK